MAVPRNRHSNARRNSKRAHHAKKPTSSMTCQTCNATKLPHRVCTACGHYANRKIIDIRANG